MLLSHVAFWVALEFWLPRLRDPEYGRRLHAVRQLVAEGRGRSLVLVLGSSRVVMGLRPDVLADEPAAPIVFNAGRVGAGPLMQEILLRRYLAAGIRPAAVYIEIWPQLFNGREEERLERGRVRLSDLWALRPGSADRGVLWADALATSFSSWADYRFELLYTVLPQWSGSADRSQRQVRGWTWLNLDRRGWLPLAYAEFDRVPRSEIIGRMRGYYEPVLRDLVLDPQVEADYRSLLRLCRERGLSAALLYLPESSEFRAFYGQTTWDRFEALVGQLRDEFVVPLIDGRLVVDDAALPDGHHLSPRGAATFTQWFGRAVLGQPGGGRVPPGK